MKFKIISAYKGIQNYIQKAECLKNGNMEELWLQHVIEPYWSEWAAGQFNEERTREELSKPIRDINNLKKALVVLDQSGVEEKVKNAYRRIITALPPQEEGCSACIMINTNIDASVHGIVGSCVGDNMLLQINPLIEGWEKYIPWAMAHEHHHSIWGYDYFFVKGNRSTNLLTSLIVDGQADSFAKAICPELSPFWTRALSLEQEREQWNFIKNHFNSEDREIYKAVFFGSRKEDIPPYTAYTIGFHIVQSYLKNHVEISFAKLLAMDSMEILRESGYEACLEVSE